jgi:ribosomal-protein-alanine N-acetyltransferase
MTVSKGRLGETWADTPGLPVETDRLRLIPATSTTLASESSDRTAFAKAVGATVPDNWPPQPCLDPDSPDGAAWWIWYFVRRRTDGEEPVLVGFGGFKGWPAVTGAVQLGCAFLEQHQAKGYGTEAVHAMTQWALAQSVGRVVAEVPFGNTASIKVLTKLGFKPAGSQPDEKLLRYERLRA